uniref:FKBPL protein n=1 Tax=Cyanoderma ruficeps TaxID=181631 RepID=A0A8C3QN28_9PASS
MEGAAPANGEAAPHEAANETRDTQETLANQQRDEELAVANEGRQSRGSANEDTEPREATNDSEELQPANEDAGHKTPANENAGHNSPTNERTGGKAAANEDTAPAAANENPAPQPPANQNAAPAANASRTRRAPPNRDTPPQDRNNDLAALPAAANQASDPWDWSLEEAWLWGPPEEGPEGGGAEPEGWGAEPDDDEEDEAEVEEGPERWRPSPDGAWAKLIVRPGRGLERPGPGSWCRVRLTLNCSGHSPATGTSSDPSASGSGHSLTSGPSLSVPGQSLTSDSSVSGSSHSLTSDPSASSSGHGLTSDPSVSICSHGLTSDPSASGSSHSLTPDPCVSISSHGLTSDPSASVSGRGLPTPLPLPVPGRGLWLTVQLGTAEGRWSSLLDAGLETMTAGELSVLRPHGVTSTTLTVRLARFTPSPPFWTSPSASRWRSVTSGRSHAADLLSRGLLTAAGRAFSRSLRAAAAASGPPPLPPDRAKVKAELHAGLADVQLRLGLPAAAAGNAGKALALWPAHLEARYARGVARAAMRDLEAAMEDLGAVLRARPGHPGALRELRRVRGAARDRDARLARRLGRLFA